MIRFAIKKDVNIPLDVVIVNFLSLLCCSDLLGNILLLETLGIRFVPSD